MENTITTSGTSLVIKNLEVQDSQLVAAAKAAEAAGQDLTEFATQALKVGATVLSFANAGAGVEKLDHSIEAAKRAMEQAGQQTSKQLQEFVARIAGDDGTLQEIMARRIEEFRVRLESITADEQSPLRRGVQTQLNEAIRLLTERVTLDLQNQKREIGELLKPESPTSPLQVFAERMERIEGSVGHIQTMMDQAVGRDLESAQGTQKGLSYERQVWDVVAEIAAQMGDDSRETGGTPGFIKNNRKGDGVVTFRETNAVASLVVEMKDVKMEGKSTDKRREYWRDLSKESRENRGAVGFLGLCKKIENMPQQYRLVALDNSMTNWVLAFDPETDDTAMIRLAYSVMRVSCLAATQSMLTNDVDAARISTFLKKAVDDLDSMEQIRKISRSIKSQADDIAKESERIQDGILESINNAKRELLVAASTLVENYSPVTHELEQQ